MEGVEILNQYEIVAEAAMNWTVFWIVFTFLSLLGTIGGLYYCFSEDASWEVIPAFVVCGLTVGVAFGGLFGSAFEIPTKYETHYQIIVSDEIKMTEFNERYEILDQDGKIYTVREK